MMNGKNYKMQLFLNYRVRVISKDNRSFIGVLKAFDQHMNLIIGECEESRTINPKTSTSAGREEKRTLGFVLIRGENIVTLSIEGPPPPEEGLPRVPLPGGMGGPGGGRAAGRGSGPGGPSPGLQGPAPGLGGPLHQHMAPGSRGQMLAPPQMRGGPMMGGPPGTMGALPGMGRGGAGRGGMRRY